MNVDLYLRVREREGRIYSDDVVARLPAIRRNHPLAKEWQARAASARRLNAYLARRSRPLSILELGCGNGWLSNLLQNAGHRVIGLDRNRFELGQAARVFSTAGGPLFVDADIFVAPLPAKSLDAIIVVSAIQYFPDLTRLVKQLAQFLKTDGELLIADSPLYSDEEVERAVLATRKYYAALGFPEMSARYFHHTLSALQSFGPILLSSPTQTLTRLKNFLGYADSPFPMIALRKSNIE